MTVQDAPCRPSELDEESGSEGDIVLQTAPYFYVVVGLPGIKVSHLQSKPNRDFERMEDSVSVNTAAELKRAGVSPAFKHRRRWRYG